MPRQKCDNYEICAKYGCIFGVCEESQESDLMLAASGIRQCSPALRARRGYRVLAYSAVLVLTQSRFGVLHHCITLQQIHSKLLLS